MVNGTHLLALPAGPSLLPTLGVSWVGAGVQNPARPHSLHSGREPSDAAESPRVVVFLSLAGIPTPRWRGRRRWAVELPSSLWWCTWSSPGHPSGSLGQAGGVASSSLALGFPQIHKPGTTAHWWSFSPLRMAEGIEPVTLSMMGVSGCCRPVVASPWCMPAHGQHSPTASWHVSDSDGCCCASGVPSGQPGPLKEGLPSMSLSPILFVGGGGRAGPSSWRAGADAELPWQRDSGFPSRLCTHGPGWLLLPQIPQLSCFPR